MAKSKQLELKEKQDEKGGESFDSAQDKKKTAREEKAEQRKKAKKQDKMARWSGMILFVILLIIGFLLWVSGEVKSPSAGSGRVSPQRVVPAEQAPSGAARVIIE